MKMKQNQTFFHWIYSNLTTDLFLSKNIEVFQWLSMKSFKCRLSQYCRKYKSIYDESITFFFFFFFLIKNKLSLQLEALSNCDNFTVITILYNNDVLTWDYKDNNKYQVTMS